VVQLLSRPKPSMSRAQRLMVSAKNPHPSPTREWIGFGVQQLSGICVIRRVLHSRVQADAA
jgi:hypothetical protein